jgi:hypothetical protein
MAKVLNTAGKTPFEVVVDSTPPAIVRFVTALVRTDAKVGSSKKLGNRLKFMVWINPTMIATFEAFCLPVSFQFISATVIQLNGEIDPAKVPPKK